MSIAHPTGTIDEFDVVVGMGAGLAMAIVAAFVIATVTTPVLDGSYWYQRSLTI